MACHMVGFFFFFFFTKFNVNLLLNVGYAYFVYSHQGGGITTLVSNLIIYMSVLLNRDKVDYKIHQQTKIWWV